MSDTPAGFTDQEWQTVERHIRDTGSPMPCRRAVDGNVVADDPARKLHRLLMEARHNLALLQPSIGKASRSGVSAETLQKITAETIARIDAELGI